MIHKQRHDPPVVRGEGPPMGARFRVPQVDELVLRPRGESLAVGTEGDAHDRLRVRAQGVHGNARLRVPDDDLLVGARRGEGLAVGREIHGPDNRRVALEDPVGTAAERRGEKVAGEEFLHEPRDAGFLVGLDVLFLLGGQAGAAAGEHEQGEEAGNPCRPEMTIRHDRPLATETKLRS